MEENIAMPFIRSYCTRVSAPILLVDCIVIGCAVTCWWRCWHYRGKVHG